MNFFAYRYGRNLTCDSEFDEGKVCRTPKGKGGGQFAKKPETLAKEDQMDNLDKHGGDGGDSLSPYVKNPDGTPRRFLAWAGDLGAGSKKKMIRLHPAEGAHVPGDEYRLVHANLKNPLALTDGFDPDTTKEAWKADEDKDKYAINRFCDVMEKAGVKIDRYHVLRNYHFRDFPQYSDLIEQVGEDEFVDALTRLGYDGFVDEDMYKLYVFDKDKISPDPKQ